MTSKTYKLKFKVSDNKYVTADLVIPNAGAGVQGDGVQYIYYAPAQTTKVPSWPTTGTINPATWEVNQSNTDVIKDTHWTSVQQGIDADHVYCYVSQRTCTSGTWSAFSTPTVWTSYNIAPVTTQALNAVITRTGTFELNKRYFNGSIKSDNNKKADGESDFDSSQAFYYKDVVIYNLSQSDGTKVSVWLTPASTVTGGYVSESTAPVTYSNDSWTLNNSNWEFLYYVDAAYINTLVANNANIKNLSANEIVVTDTAGVPQAGITSSTSSKLNDYTLGDVRFWAGLNKTTNLQDANFYVTKDGILHSKDANLSGKVNTSALTVNLTNDSTYSETLDQTAIATLIANSAFTIKNKAGEVVSFFSYETKTTDGVTTGGTMLYVKDPTTGQWNRLNFANLTNLGTTTTTVYPESWDSLALTAGLSTVLATTDSLANLSYSSISTGSNINSQWVNLKSKSYYKYEAARTVSNGVTTYDSEKAQYNNLYFGSQSLDNKFSGIYFIINNDIQAANISEIITSRVGSSSNIGATYLATGEEVQSTTNYPCFLLDIYIFTDGVLQNYKLYYVYTTLYTSSPRIFISNSSIENLIEIKTSSSYSVLYNGTSLTVPKLTSSSTSAYITADSCINLYKQLNIS